VTPPAWDGTCGPQEAVQRRWGRILARGALFGCLFVLSGVVFGVIYLLVWAFSRR